MALWLDDAFEIHPSQPVLLLGNGFNNINPGYSWEDVLRAILDRIRQYIDYDPDPSKPFPLYYDELFLWAQRNGKVHEEKLAQIVGALVKNLEPISLHDKLAEIGFRHILTTNYDRALEKAIGDNRAPWSNDAPVQEFTYSLFRRTNLKDATIWHPHGEQEKPSSILLGYDHYSRYLQNLMDYTIRSVEYQGERLEGLVKRLPDERMVRSWVDFFFLTDVYILGLDLRFEESHLWWLLNRRARVKESSPDSVKGRIIYLTCDDRKTCRQRSEVLAAADVEVEFFDRPRHRNDEESWRGYYEEAMDWLGSRVA